MLFEIVVKYRACLRILRLSVFYYNYTHFYIFANNIKRKTQMEVDIVLFLVFTGGNVIFGCILANIWKLDIYIICYFSWGISLKNDK